MNKEYFILKDRIKEIESSFIQNGWLTIYENDSKSINDQCGIYCCLIDKNLKNNFNKDYRWPLLIGGEGKPSVYGDNSYKTNDKEGIEAFLFARYFNLQDRNEKYFDVSEEFIFYFNLYEKAHSKQIRKYYYIDEVGDLDEVITIEPNSIKVKLKYIKEYITIRDMNFVVCYDFMRLLPECPSEWKIKPIDKPHKINNYIYNHCIRTIDNRTQSWIIGKVLIDCNKKKEYHFGKDNFKYEKFIIGYDDNGDEVYEDCSKTNEKYFKLTYFKKEVLNKYYNEPSKYKVDGFNVRSNFFSLKIDNNVENYVPVFLVELGSLPFKEQLHWKQYNIPPQLGMGMSGTYYKTMIEGNWAEYPETADLFFKSKYKEFNKNWEKKFGWKFYKPLAKEDEYLFTSLHIPTTNNVKAFCEQVLTIVKLTIDRLNEEAFLKEIIKDKNDKGITKLEKFLKHYNFELPDMFNFLHNLQRLRSGLIAHSFSKSDKNCKKAIEYFEIKGDNYIEVANKIFEKSIFTLNTLEKIFDII